MKKILVFQWFNCTEPRRSEELRSCVEHNLALGFDSILIFNDSVEPVFSGERIHNIPTRMRIAYRDFIAVANDPANHGALVVLTNTDIKLDRKILSVAEVIQANEFLCFSRYESNGLLANAPWCTQDVWAMLAQPIHNSVLCQSDIPLGMPGCEIRFAEIMFSAGYAVFNPCLDVKNVHVHSNPAPHKDENRLYGAYLFTPACSLSDVKERTPRQRPTPCYLTRAIHDRVFEIFLS